MDIITFNSVEVKTQNFMGDISITQDDLARCLYQLQGDDRSVTPFVNAKRAVQRIYQKHADEFTECMTGMVTLTTTGGQQQVRVFSLRGAHLIAMFARTAVAKEFRRWVLDILDKQSADKTSIKNEPSEREVMAYNVEVLMSHYQAMYEAWKFQIYPALKAVESPLAGRLYDRFADGNVFLNAVNRAAQKKLLHGELARIF
ncbi:Bro-N domain-containing protein [Serratia liquefaciens]|uniref:BRO-N domain-containing protein n=1 Tax=Serratia liquefaciens TaxID=614 RepID=UPI002361ADEB|nr:hypothetical protein [Serratia liquefaciens]